MSRWLLLIVLIPSVSFAQQYEPSDKTEQLLAQAKKLVAVDADGCLLYREANEIVVCGLPEIDRQQRLPFPELAVDPNKRVREPIPQGDSEIVQQGRCYVTMSERNCFKGLSLMSVSIGGKGSGVSGPVGRLWRLVEPPVPDEDFVKQVQVKPLGGGD
ncbi:MAG: hypothetical protein Pars2KO_04430 [Parasphingorhabdus sp.]